MASILTADMAITILIVAGVILASIRLITLTAFTMDMAMVASLHTMAIIMVMAILHIMEITITIIMVIIITVMVEMYLTAAEDGAA